MLIPVLIAASTCAAAGQANLLLNGGAEQGKNERPSFWYQAAIPADGLKMYRDKEQVHSGKFSLAISNSHEYPQTVCNNWAQNIMDVPTGRIVRLSTYVRAKDADSVNVCLQCWGLQNNMLAFASTPVVRGDQDWILLYGEPVAVPAGTAKITVRAVLTGLGKAWFDDLAVVPFDLPTKSVVQDEPTESVADAELAEMVKGEIMQTLPVTKDCMILSYMPKWAHGNVDNIAVENHDGGVRTLLAWPEILPQDAADPNRSFLVALYARKTVANAPLEPMGVYEILKDWPELTSWETQPASAEKPAIRFAFVPGEGWKLFDITALIRNHSGAKGKRHGLMLRFLQENGSTNSWSGYQFVSREGAGQWLSRRPKLLIVREKK
jgi:hypothetical protein